MPHPLDSARAKVNRARQLRAQFAAENIEFVGPDAPPPYEATHTRDDGGEIRVTVAATGVSPEPPVILPLLAGEVLHQLRSAMDHVVHQLFVTNNLTPTTKTGFPIFKTKDGYLARGVTMIQGIPASAANRIQAVQPFHRGDRYPEDPLWMLQTLDNTDKHRLIPVSVISGGWLTILFPDNNEITRPVFPVEGSLVPGRELCRFPLQGYPGIKVDPYLLCMVAFAEVAGRRDIAILPFLKLAINHVTDIVESFAAEFPS
jgi:hypothetical protein